MAGAAARERLAAARPSSWPRAPFRSPGSSRPGSAPSCCWGTSTAGCRTDVVESADLCVEIPMVGQGASLNVAVAGSLVLYRLAGLA